MPTLEKLAVPQLWILGGNDLEAPSEETARRLQKLVAAGRPITIALYPRAEHGMTEFERAADGQRVSTRYARGYFEMIRDYALHTRIEARYGDSTVIGPDRRELP